MAAEIPTPVCEATGLPLPIVPTEPPEGALSVFKDDHHPWHPWPNDLLQGVDGKAVRYSRVQFLSRVIHERYHDFSFTGSSLPDNNTDRFRLVVLACAGVVPRQAIDLSEQGSYEIVTLSNQEYERLAAPSSIHIDRFQKRRREPPVRETIGNFLASYALKQNIHVVLDNAEMVDQFLDSKTRPKRKNELGNLILVTALSKTIRELEPLHAELKQEGYVPDSRVKSLRKLMKKLFRVQFFTPELFPDYEDTLVSSLSDYDKQLQAA